jgi:hypothetical protein
MKLPQGNDFSQAALKMIESKRETAMDRRLFVTGLLGAGATAALGVALPRQAEALVAVPPRAVSPSSGLPDLNAPDEFNAPDALDAPDAEAASPDSPWEDDVEFVNHRRRRRRRRVRRWRRQCRRHWYHGHWRRRCHRVRHWVWIWLSI